MRKIETMFLGSALAVALSAPAMAADFHALAGLQGATPAPVQDGVLALTEGGATCALPSGLGGAEGGGAAYCGFVIGASGSLSATPVGVDIPLTANILNVTVP
ncbi:MAG: hypothetical protein ACREYF_27055 [Gammaproteobacteria bacterium]